MVRTHISRIWFWPILWNKYKEIWKWKELMDTYSKWILGVDLPTWPIIYTHPPEKVSHGVMEHFSCIWCVSQTCLVPHRGLVIMFLRILRLAALPHLCIFPWFPEVLNRNHLRDIWVGISLIKFIVSQLPSTNAFRLSWHTGSFFVSRNL